ncbi:MAG: CRISPR-associated endonuclease Cas2 [Clostridia bacterium]|nr:CRISPR-associated endonuclease Cas2 [Clostridia bacterium]
MFVVVSYDISSPSAGNRARKLCEAYLRRIQKSVYEGEISEKKLGILKAKLCSAVRSGEDSVIVYRFSPTGYPFRESLGGRVLNEDEFI